MNQTLTVHDHSREVLGLRYVYPVLSRRAGGVSVGINLNPNNACNWHCLYCQVPNLSRGGPPPLDMALLEQELRGFLLGVRDGDFMSQAVPDGMRRLVDVAFSGNGEPTSAPEFAEAVALVCRVLAEMAYPEPLPIRLISNGSLLDRPQVQSGLKQLAAWGGEVWFKVDAGTPERMAVVNGVATPAATVVRRLQISAQCCPTWVQTCVFRLDGFGPSVAEVDTYLEILRQAGVEQLQGVLLYGLARPSLQAEAERLTSLPLADMESLAARIKQQGLAVKLSP